MLVVDNDRVVEVSDDFQPQQDLKIEEPAKKRHIAKDDYAHGECIRLFPEGEITGIQINGKIFNEREAEVEAGTEEKIERTSKDYDFAKTIQKVKVRTANSVTTSSIPVTTVILPKAQYERALKLIKESNGLIKIDIFHKRKDFDFPEMNNKNIAKEKEELLRKKERMQQLTRIDDNKDTKKMDEDIADYIKNHDGHDNFDKGAIKM